MALETLIDHQQQAAELMGIDYEEVAALQEPRLAMEDEIEIGGHPVPVFRAHSGADFSDEGHPLAGKGGIRMADYPSYEAAVATVKELSVEMLFKLALRGYNGRFKGAKGLIVADASVLSHMAREEAMRRYENRMEDANLASYLSDIPAGDVGSNGTTSAYAREYRRRNPDDPFWRAVITGKDVADGGLDFRPAATGWGGYVTQKAIMDVHGHDRAFTAVQGFGNVGAWHSHFASTSHDGRTPVNAISDKGGTLVTNNPDGLRIERWMVDQIGDNPGFIGDKIHALSEAVRHNQRGIDLSILPSNAILSYPTDYLVPAAMGNVIRDDNVGDIRARLGLIADANGPFKGRNVVPLLVSRGLIVVPDIVANGAGVDCSIKEVDANLGGYIPNSDQVQRELTQMTEDVVVDVLTAAEHLNTRNLGVAAAAVGIARLMNHDRPAMLRELIAA